MRMRNKNGKTNLIENWRWQQQLCREIATEEYQFDGNRIYENCIFSQNKRFKARQNKDEKKNEW